MLRKPGSTVLWPQNSVVLQGGFKGSINYTASYGCHFISKNHRVILQCSIPLGGIFSSVVAFKAAIKAIS